MTTRSIFWRVFWKEYRLQRPLWIAMAVLTALLLGIEFVIVDPPEKIPWMFWLALALPAIYPLGCGATLFAGEHEAGTYEFQRSLPTEARQVFLAKMLFALVSAVILFGLMWLLAAFLSDWIIPGPAQWKLPAMMGASGLLAFLWAAFFSLLLKHVLTAAVLGGTATFVSILIVARLVIYPADSPDMPYLSLFIRLVVVAAIVALLNLWLGTRWFQGRRHDRLRSLLPIPSSDASTCSTVSDDRNHLPKARTIIRRLLWQHWKQNAWILPFVIAVPFSPFLLYLVQIPSIFADHEHVHILFFKIILSLVPCLLGVYTFHADQNGNSFRFLADRGISPKYIWLSRQMLVLLFVLLVQFAAELLSDLSRIGVYSAAGVSGWSFFVMSCMIWLFLFTKPVIIAVCVGQLFSMFFRSAILAVVFSLLLASVLSGWCWLMILWQINPLWSQLTIPLVLLLATWLRTPYWLLERNDWRAWLPSGLALAVPTAVILTCVAFHRAYEIPLVDPGFSSKEFNRPMTSEERKTLDLYQQAIRKMASRKVEKGSKVEDAWKNTITLTDKDIAWVNANEETIGLAIKASRGKLLPAESNSFEQKGMLNLGRLLVDRAAMLEKQKKLDEAFDCYCTAIRISLHLRDLDSACEATRIEMYVYAHLTAWSMQPDQTSERIVTAVRQLKQLTSNVSTINGIKLAYFRMQRAIEGDPNAMDAKYFPKPEFTTLWLRLPWERERALRLLNEQTRTQLASASRMEKAVRKGERSFSLSPPYDPSNHPWRGYFSYPSHSWLGVVIYGVPNPYDFGQRIDNLNMDYAIQETSRRAIQLILALEAWKLQHGSLPESLDELVGSCLDQLPVDPCSGEPFRYFRKGVPWFLASAKFGWPYMTAKTGSKDLAPRAPFFWSTGLEIRRISHSGDILSQYELRNGARRGAGRMDDWRRPNSPYQIWVSGWPFPIP